MNELPLMCKFQKAHFVYIIECADGSLYTGFSTDPHKRFEAHASGKGAKYTRSRGVKHFLLLVKMPSLSAALQTEAWIKKKSRDQKNKLVTQVYKSNTGPIVLNNYLVDQFFACPTGLFSF